jgi:acetylornithine deacetylase
LVREEVQEWILRECARDDWLAEHPPTFTWWTNGVMPMEIPASELVVATMLQASADLGLRRELGGLDSWYDGATYTLLGGIPSIGYGPPGFDPDGATVAHTIDEYVPVDGLVACAQALAVAAMRFCGVAS